VNIQTPNAPDSTKNVCSLRCHVELMAQYSVSRITVRKAIEELVHLGLVEKRQGAGSTIIGKTMVSS
jgi:DNA-binding GntR family transcriptional regulator